MPADLSCRWMSLKLRSPLVVASLTPMSKASLKQHVAFFGKAIKKGAGAVVLPSINPERHGSADGNDEWVETCIVATGMGNNDPMAFTVLGPTVPNIISVEYGLNLASATCATFHDTPIIASVVNLGREDQLIDIVASLCNLGIAGIELNCSCPNVETLSGKAKPTISRLVNMIRTVTDKPISLKLTPYQDCSCISKEVGAQIDGVTLSNAHIGLLPPRLDGESYSPFRASDYWAPGGFYGPFARPSSFYRLYQFQDIARRFDLDIACVGGMSSGEDAVRAVLLGASVIEVASGIQWHGTEVFKQIADGVAEYMEASSKQSIAAFKGAALESIRPSADEVPFVKKHGHLTVNQEKCFGCISCKCVDRLCFAFSKAPGEKARIDETLCSACGWCAHECIGHAVDWLP